MTIEHNHCPSPQYRFEMNVDGCDEVLDIYGSDEKQPPISIRYWTGAGVAASLIDLFPITPGLRTACELLLAELDDLLRSDDPQSRAEGERESELIAGLRAALTGAAVTAS